MDRPITVSPRFVELFDVLLVEYEAEHGWNHEPDSDVPTWVAEARRMRAEARLQRTMDKVRKEIASLHLE